MENEVGEIIMQQFQKVIKFDSKYMLMPMGEVL
jgi:hypothetical protein